MIEDKRNPRLDMLGYFFGSWEVSFIHTNLDIIVLGLALSLHYVFMNEMIIPSIYMTSRVAFFKF